MSYSTPRAPRPPAHTRRITQAWWWFGVLLVGVAVLASTPFGGWVQSFVFGSGVRWQEAYTALEAAETMRPGNARERDRLLLAEAYTQSEPPVGLPLGPRLHPAGTLARVRYELFDENGAPLDAWEVRALLPTLGNGEGPFWREHCGRACAAELQRSQGLRLERSGEQGLAEEWVLRMPVGKTFELRPTPLRTHDLLDARARDVPLASVRVGDRSVQRPARIQVTLVEACRAMVRVGTTLELEVFPFAILPIPSGFRRSRWAQLNGCGQLEAFAPPPVPPPVQATPRRVEPPPDLRALVARRDPGTGYIDLKVDEQWLREHAQFVVTQVSTVCRYDTVSDQWQKLVPPNPRVSVRIDPQAEADAHLGERVAFEVPREIALFWLVWTEQRESNRSGRAVRLRDALVGSGPIQCNDLALGPEPEGRIAACVPFADRAEARFVPAPAQACQ